MLLVAKAIERKTLTIIRPNLGRSHTNIYKAILNTGQAS